MPSPLGRPHGKTDWMVATWAGVYAGATPGCDGASNSTWFMRTDAPQPDCALCLLPEFGGKSGEAGPYRSGPAEFVAEVSVSSKERDLGPKLQLYQKTGVKEYLTVLIQEEEATPGNPLDRCRHSSPICGNQSKGRRALLLVLQYFLTADGYVELGC